MPCHTVATRHRRPAANRCGFVMVVEETCGLAGFQTTLYVRDRALIVHSTRHGDRVRSRRMSVSVSPSVAGDMMRCCASCGAVYRKDFRRCANDGLELVETETDPLIGTEVGAYMV